MKKWYKRYHWLFFIFCTITLYPSISSAQIQFADVTEEAGIDHIFGIFEGTFGGGAAVIDYNNDGWEDVFIAGGKSENQLLKNNGDGTFTKVSPAGFSSLSDLVTQSATVADVNKDGWPDLFVTTIARISGNTFKKAPNVLLINTKDGDFEDQSETWNLTESTFSTSASFGDVNRDGYPDLYVCNYFENYDGGLDQYGGPIFGSSTRPGKDLFYINDQGRGFIEASEAYGIERMGLTFQALWTDVDNDNDLDILVANDFGNRGTPNLLYRNDFPQNSFTEIGTEKEFDFGINGMGIAACDVNMDGWLDYFVTNIQASPFFINRGAEATFFEQSIPRGTGFFHLVTDSGYRANPVSWGANFFDVDHDMDQDLYVTNGCLNPILAPNPNLLLENDKGKFQDIAKATQTNDHSIGRGSVVFDYDHDGDLDLLVVNQQPHNDEEIGVEFRGTRLYQNNTNSFNHWLKLQLKGQTSESNGIGARVEVFVERRKLVREVYGGSSHASQNSLLAHFGLGQSAMVDSIRISWPASQVQLIKNVQADQLITVEEEAPAFEDITLYPNPFSDLILIDVPSRHIGATAQVQLISLTGQVLAESQISGLRPYANALNLHASISPGIYLLQLSGEGFSYTQKLVKGN